ncbi:MAG: hypothetical protein JWO49_70 [Arthrobacter sp.]|nr:hypothetical protein [Arthrobacter sp.]
MASSGSGKAGGIAGPPCPSAPSATDADVLAPAQGGMPPVLDLTVLADLESEVNGPAVAHSFARDYITLWNRRLEKLTSALDNNDGETALDASLSLKNSSAMVGATRLSALAKILRQFIGSGNLSGARSLLPQVAEQGHETIKELRQNYLRSDG